MNWILNVEWLASVASTQDVVKDRLRKLEPAEQSNLVYCLGADVQTDGRGRRGSPWVQGSINNLAVSFGFSKQFGQGLERMLSIWSGGMVVEHLWSQGVQGAFLKWPNDICFYQDGRLRKAGGILVERILSKTYVVGLGLNLDVNLGPPHAISLSSLGYSLQAKEFSTTLGERLCQQLAKSWTAFEVIDRAQHSWMNPFWGAVGIDEEGRAWKATRLDPQDGSLVVRSADGVGANQTKSLEHPSLSFYDGQIGPSSV